MNHRATVQPNSREQLIGSAPADVRRTEPHPITRANPGPPCRTAIGNPRSRTCIRAIDQLLFQQITPPDSQLTVHGDIPGTDDIEGRELISSAAAARQALTCWPARLTRESAVADGQMDLT
jgi:hypothetical protein